MLIHFEYTLTSYKPAFYINPFHAHDIFLYPVKTLENQVFKNVFREYRKIGVAYNKSIFRVFKQIKIYFSKPSLVTNLALWVN